MIAHGGQHRGDLVRFPGLGARVLPVGQDLRGQQAENAAEQKAHGGAIAHIPRIGDRFADQPIELGVDLAFDGWDKADIDEVELVVRVDPSDGFGAMDNVGCPVQVTLLERLLETLDREPI